MTKKTRYLENWMERLTYRVRKGVPIIYLAIPGSHNTMTYGIKCRSRLGADAEPAVRKLDKLCPCFVSRWSKTQQLDITKQLMLGIRYLDIRLAYDAKSKEICYSHGLLGMPMKEPLFQVNKFLENHPKELVIIDFQHFYDINFEGHERIKDIVLKTFGERMLTARDGNLEDFTLNFCEQWAKQVLIIYRGNCESERGFWGEKSWPTPWPDETTSEGVRDFLKENIKERKEYTGYVSQCVLTPSKEYIRARFFLSLRYSAKKVLKRVLPWIYEQRPGELDCTCYPRINVLIADFIEIKNAKFCRVVVDLNRYLY